MTKQQGERMQIIIILVMIAAVCLIAAFWNEITQIGL